MAHYARINDDNRVTDIIVVSDYDCLDSKGKESEAVGAKYCKKLFGGKWIKVSYSGSIRGMYPPIGGYYDAKLDRFFRDPRPYPSWIPDDEGGWTAPIPKPLGRGEFEWNEETRAWKLLPLSLPDENVLTAMMPMWDEESQSYVVDMFDGTTVDFQTMGESSPIYEWDESEQRWIVINS